MLRKRVLHTVITAVLLLSMASSAWVGWRLLSDWPGSALMARSSDQIVAQIDRALARYVTETTIENRLSELLDETPRNWLAIEAIEDIAEERGLNIDTDLQQQRDLLFRTDTGMWATSRRCALCAYNTASCDFSLVLVCRAPIDLTPAGDLVGVVREGSNYVRGLDVDMIDLGLSAIGLAAVALIPATGGSSGTVKVGAGLSKTAWRMGHLSPSLLPPFRRAFREGFDWARISSVRSQADLVSIARPDVLQPASNLLADAGRLNDAVGSQRALYMLSKVDNPADLRRFAAATDQIGPRAVGAIETLGKSRFLRATMRWSDDVWYLVAGIMGFVSGLVGLFWNTLSTVLLKLLSRKAKGR